MGKIVIRTPSAGVLAVFITVLLHVPVSSLEPSDNLPEWVPRGPVLEVKEYRVPDPNVPDVRRPVQNARFSESGRIEKLVRYVPDHRRPVTQRFSYDAEDRLESWFAQDEQGAMLWGYRFRYTSEGDLMQETEFDREGDVAGHRAFLYYRDNGEVRVEESAYDSRGEVLWWMQRIRDTGFGGEEWSVYYPDGRVITEGVRKFDHLDRLVHEEEIDRTTNERTITTYEYDTGDRPIRVEHRDSTGSVTRSEEYQYDENGNPVLHRITTDSEERRIVRRYQYEYDRYGNWTRRESWYMVTEETRLRSIDQDVRVREFTYRELSGNGGSYGTYSGG